jgi:hypothetical protein
VTAAARGAEFTAALFMAELEALEAKRAYMRPGDPRGLCFTAQQWADYDEWTAHVDRMEKYGRLVPRAFASMRAMATGMGIW